MLDKIKGMKVGEKLKFCFTLVVIIASISGVAGMGMILRSDIAYSNALVTNGFSQGEIGIFSTYLNKEPSIVRELILVHDEVEMKESEAELAQIQELTNEAATTMIMHCNSPEEAEYIDIIKETLPEYRDVFNRVKEYALNNQDEEAYDLLMVEGKPTLKKLTNAVEGLIDLNVEMGYEVSNSLTIQSYILMGAMAVIIAVAVFISMRLAAFVSKLFSDPIIRVKDASAELAKGNLNIEIEKMYPDEIGEMTESFQEAAEMLKLYIRELSRGLGEVANGNFDIYTDVDFKGDFKELEVSLEKL